MKVVYKLNGKKVSRTEFLEKSKGLEGGAPGIGHPTGWPLRSLGLGVPRAQVGQFNRMYAEAGITGAHHEPDGTLVLDSRGARRNVCRVRGVRDNDSGYGDFAGKH